MYENKNKNRWRQLIRTNYDPSDNVLLNTQMRANKYGRKTVRLLLESKMLRVEKDKPKLSTKEQVDIIMTCFRFLSSTEKYTTYFTHKNHFTTKKMYQYLFVNQRVTKRFNLLLLVDLETIITKLLETEEPLTEYENKLLKAVYTM